MTRDEALLARLGMEHVGWVGMRVAVSYQAGQAAYGVSGVNPTTGIRGPWRWQYGEVYVDGAPVPVSTREWLA